MSISHDISIITITHPPNFFFFFGGGGGPKSEGMSVLIAEIHGTKRMPRCSVPGGKGLHDAESIGFCADVWGSQKQKKHKKTFHEIGFLGDFFRILPW